MAMPVVDLTQEVEIRQGDTQWPLESAGEVRAEVFPVHRACPGDRNATCPHDHQRGEEVVEDDEDQAGQCAKQERPAAARALTRLAKREDGAGRQGAEYEVGDVECRDVP